MKKELRAQILAYNKSIKEKGDKASDLDVIIAELMKLPPGQLKKVLTDEVKSVLQKHGLSL